MSFVAVGDLNGDSKLDLAVASTSEDSTGRLYIYLGTGSGGFTASPQSPISTGSSNACWVGIAQVTSGDSNADVVVAGFGDSDQGQTTIFGNNINVFQGDGTGAVNSIGTVTNGLAFIPTAIAIADFNDDGDADFAATVPGVPPDVSSPQPAGIVQLFTGNGLGGFTVSNSFSTGGALPISIQVAYLNADSLPDLVIANAGDPDGANSYTNFGINSSVGVAINTGGMNFNTNPFTAGLGVGGSKSVFAVTVADFDLDGKQDIGAIVYGHPLTGANARILEYKGDGAGGFSANADSPFNTLTTDGQYLAAAPLDGNGSPDIVYSTAGGKYGVLLNTTVTGPTVTINKGASQADPTNATSIVFDVVFSEGVTGFDETDISFTGSSGGTPTASVTPINSSLYTVTVTGMAGTGTVRASIPAAAATSIADSVASLASTSTDNQVAFDLVVPTVTINQAGSQADPASSGPILFTVVFSENVTGFANADVDLSGSSLSGLSALVTQNSPLNYTVSVSGMSGNGTVVARVVANAASDPAGNLSAASTSTDNSVTFGTPSAPTVTINQGSSQLDPTNATSIVFDVVFSAGVSGFTGGDIDFTGSTVGGLSASVTPISSTAYTVAVTGMSGTGTVRASIPAGAATSIAGSLASQASTSSDNQVTFDLVSPTVTINQASGQADPTLSGPILFTVVFSENVTGFGNNDIDLSSSSLSGLSAVVTQNTPSNYTVSVSGMTGGGTVVAKVVAGAGTDAVGNPSAASTSGDNSVTFVNASTGTLGFKQAVYNTTEDAAIHTVTITVTRSGLTEGAVSINYGTADGTAHSGGLASTGQADYTPTSNTLSWADGEGGDKSFTVDILPDTLNEGTELINLVLTNPTGGPSLGLTAATAAIAPSDGKVIDGTVKLPAAVFPDAAGLAGDLVTVRLTGKVGTATVFKSDPDGDGFGPIERIDLANTDPAKSALTIKVKKAKGGFGDGRSKLGEVIGSGLKSLTATSTDLEGLGINLGGFLGTIKLGNVSGGADIILAAPSALIKRPAVKITAGVIGDGTDITVLGAPLASLTAFAVGDGTITAPSVGAINAKGKSATRTASAIIGNFNSDVIVTGGVAAGKLALTKLRAAGSITGANINVTGSLGTISVGGRGVGDFMGTISVSENLNSVRVAGKVNETIIDVTGNVNSVIVGSFWNSRLDSGYTGSDDGLGTYDLPTTIGTFKVTAKFDGFQSSNVIASIIKSVTLASVNPENPLSPGTKFGVTAEQVIMSLVVTSPTQTFKFNPNDSSPQSTPALGLFEAKHRLNQP